MLLYRAAIEMTGEASKLWLLKGFAQAYGLQPEGPSPTAILVGGGQILAFLDNEKQVCTGPCNRKIQRRYGFVHHAKSLRT